MSKAAVLVAVGLCLLACADATIHKVYNLHLQLENRVQQHVNDTNPITDDCHWFEKNGTTLDDGTFVKVNATTENGKGYCVLVVKNFELQDNGKLIMLKYRGHTYGVQIFEGPDPNRYFFIFLLIVLHVAMLLFVISFAMTYRTCRRRSGQVKLLLVPS